MSVLLDMLLWSIDYSKYSSVNLKMNQFENLKMK